MATKFSRRLEASRKDMQLTSLKKEFPALQHDVVHQIWASCSLEIKKRRLVWRTSCLSVTSEKIIRYPSRKTIDAWPRILFIYITNKNSSIPCSLRHLWHSARPNFMKGAGTFSIWSTFQLLLVSLAWCTWVLYYKQLLLEIYLAWCFEALTRPIFWEEENGSSYQTMWILSCFCKTRKLSLINSYCIAIFFYIIANNAVIKTLLNHLCSYGFLLFFVKKCRELETDTPNIFMYCLSV